MALAVAPGALPFAPLWRRVEAESPALRLGAPLRPSALPREIDAVERLLHRLRAVRPKAVQAIRSAVAPADPIDIQLRAEPRPDAVAAPMRR